MLCLAIQYGAKDDEKLEISRQYRILIAKELTL
jgi:hypothetical protein